LLFCGFLLFVSLTFLLSLSYVCRPVNLIHIAQCRPIFFCFSPFRLPIVSKTLSRLTLCFSLWFRETAAQAPRRGRFHPVVLLAEQRRNAESAHHTPASQILRVGRQRVATIKGKYSGTILSSLKRKKNTGFGFFRRRFLPLGSGNLRSLFVQVRQVLFIPTSSARSYTRQY
jgi:hypothetical protein